MTNKLSDRMLFLQILLCCIALILSEENLDTQEKTNRSYSKGNIFFLKNDFFDIGENRNFSLYLPHLQQQQLLLEVIV